MRQTGERRPEPKYVHQEYPKFMHNAAGEKKIVKSEAALVAMEGHWIGMDDSFQKKPKPAPSTFNEPLGLPKHEEADLSDLSAKELRAMCAARSIAKSGSKSAMIERLSVQ